MIKLNKFNLILKFKLKYLLMRIKPLELQSGKDSTRLAGYEITPDNQVNEEGEFIHFALLADAKPINY